jgi:hypothetical protein
VRRERVGARGEVGERRALQHVAGVDQHHASGVRTAQRVDHRGGAGERAGRVGRGGEVVPAAQVAVHVGGGREHQVERVALGAAGRGRRGVAGPGGAAAPAIAAATTPSAVHAARRRRGAGRASPPGGGAAGAEAGAGAEVIAVT